MNSELEHWQKFENYAQHNLDFTAAEDHYKQFQILFYFRILTEFLLSAVFIYIGLNFLILSYFTLAIWPATGVALTLVFMRGYYPCLGILVGAFFAYYLNSHLFSFCALQAIGFTTYIYLTRYLALRWIGAIQPLNNLFSLILFLGLVATTTACHTFLHQTIILYFALPWPYSLQDTFTHFLAQFNGVLCLTPLTLILDPFVPKAYFSFNKKNLSWWLISGSILVGCVSFIFFDTIIPTSIFLPTLCLTTWGFAYYYKQIPTATLLLLIGILYLGGIMDFSTTLKTHGLLKEILLMVIGGVSLMIASYTRSSI